MVRKLAAAMLGVGVFIPGLANALGLGEIKLNSALSEPLDAEIELVQVRELTASEIIPTLASEEDFDSSHVERFHFLTDLRFEVVLNGQGRSFVKVSSRKPVKEPFLNFLVEVNWPAGRLLREYTLLLDPPIYSKQKAQPVSGPSSTASAPAAITPAANSVPTYQPATTPQSTYSADSYSSSPQTHTITSNDSLWAIAQDMKPSSRVNIQQTMMALQRNNPEAFIDNNINLLKKGQVLRAPTEEEAMQLSSREAIALAAEQNRIWQQRLTRTAKPLEARQIDLSGRSAEPVPESSPETSESRLKLVGGSDNGASESGQGGAGSEGQLRDQLALAEENADKFKLENNELKLKVDDLEDQLDTSGKVLTLKDEQIAALQAKLKELEKERAELRQSVAADIAEAPVETEQSPVFGQSDETLAKAAAAAEGGLDEDVDFNYSEDGAGEVGALPAPETGTLEPASDMAGPEKTGFEAEPESANDQIASQLEQQQTQSPQPQQGFVQKVLNNPLYLALGGGAIMLLLVLIILASRRKSEEVEEDDAGLDSFELPEAQDHTEMPRFESVDLEEDDAFEEAVESSVDEHTIPQTSDVIAEADIYIAYGRFPQAIEMLEAAAESEPDRADIRLKLCEVCAEANDSNVFMQHYGVLQNLGDAESIARADELRGKLTSHEDELTSSFDGLPDDVASDDITALDSDTDFDFDQAQSVPSSEISELDAESDTGLNFNLSDIEDTSESLDSIPNPLADLNVASDVKAQDEVAGLDFDLDLNLDEDVKDDAPSSAAGSEPDMGLDFDVQGLSEGESLPEAAVPDLDFPGLDESSVPELDNEVDSKDDLDLDFDTGTSDAVEADQSEDEPVLDSQSAAALASELDVDLDSDFLAEDDVVEEAPSTEEPVSQDGDATTIIADLDSVDVSDQFTSLDDELGGSDEELDFLSDADEASTKLDLARAYIDMGDRDGAKDILDEVMVEGNDSQVEEAKSLMDRLES